MGLPSIYKTISYNLKEGEKAFCLEPMPYEQTIRHACLFVSLGYISCRNGFGMLVPQDLFSEALLSSPLLPACKNGSLRPSANKPDDGIKAVELEAASGSTAAVFSTPGTSCPEARASDKNNTIIRIIR